MSIEAWRSVNRRTPHAMVLGVSTRHTSAMAAVYRVTIKSASTDARSCGRRCRSVPCIFWLGYAEIDGLRMAVLLRQECVKIRKTGRDAINRVRVRTDNDLIGIDFGGRE